MPGEGLSNIKIEGEKLLALADQLGMEKARALANDQKLKALGMLTSLLSRPKPEEIEISYEEKRFEAFWHVQGASRFEYKRRKSYRIPVETVVQDVEILGTSFTIPKAEKAFEIEGIERCVEEYHEEAIVNAENGEPAAEFAKYISRQKQTIESTDELTKDGAFIVALEAKPAFIVRKIVNALIKPIKADTILDEQIGIEQLALYFVPVYTFELYWKTKDKRVTISFDGATGELRPKASKIADRLRKSFTNDEIFEFGKEIANFVPGGGLAMMVGKKAIELTKKKES